MNPIHLIPAIKIQPNIYKSPSLLTAALTPTTFSPSGNVNSLKALVCDVLPMPPMISSTVLLLPPKTS